MADKTKIEWADATWNVITGCSVTSPGCTNCYAMRLAGTRLREHPSRNGLTKIVKGKPVWTGEVRFNEQWLTQPLEWKKPRRIFVAAHGDLFHESVPDEWIDRVFAVMALAPRHTFQVLTKRSARMHAYMTKNTQAGWMTGHACGRIGDAIERMRLDNRPVGPTPHGEPGSRWWPLPNVMLGVTVEDQARAGERIPDLLATPAAKRFVSIEPTLGRIVLTDVDLYPFLFRGRARTENDPKCTFDALTGRTNVHPINGVGDPFDHGLDLVIVGGESGPGSRPMHPDWPRSLRDQCKAAGVPFFFKQWGEWAPTPNIINDTLEAYRARGGRDTMFYPDGSAMELVGKRRAGRLLDGEEHNGEV